MRVNPATILFKTIDPLIPRHAEQTARAPVETITKAAISRIRIPAALGEVESFIVSPLMEKTSSRKCTGKYSLLIPVMGAADVDVHDTRSSMCAIVVGPEIWPPLILRDKMLRPSSSGREHGIQFETCNDGKEGIIVVPDKISKCRS